MQQTVKGRKFIVDGVEMELFPTGALCKVLERNHRCLYKWEKNFNFPAALWRFRDLKTVNRWYSKNQLIAILTVIEALGWLKGKNRNKLPAFIKAVRAVFYKVDQPTVARNDK